MEQYKGFYIEVRSNSVHAESEDGECCWGDSIEDVKAQIDEGINSNVFSGDLS